MLELFCESIIYVEKNLKKLILEFKETNNFTFDKNLSNNTNEETQALVLELKMEIIIWKKTLNKWKSDIINLIYYQNRFKKVTNQKMEKHILKDIMNAEFLVDCLKSSLKRLPKS